MRTLTLTAALTLGRPVWATELGTLLVVLIAGAAFTALVARWAWRQTA